MPRLPPMALWPCGPVALWPCGPVALWPCGPVALPVRMFRLHSLAKELADLRLLSTPSHA